VRISPARGAEMISTEQHVQYGLHPEPEHDGREAVTDQEQEARPHPADTWARFLREVCAGCHCC